MSEQSDSPATLDRSAALPLWAQLERLLRYRIATGAFDESFPTEIDLADTYGISRQTVREAIRRLVDDGTVERVRGRGTWVTHGRISQPLGVQYSLFRSLEEQGVVQRSDALRAEIERNDDVAGRLGLGASDDLVVIERLRLADGEPLALDTVWLPAAIAAPLLDSDWSHTALYDELEGRCGVHLDGGWERIQPVMPTERERDLLGMSGDVAAFRVERQGCSGDDVVEWRQTLIRGDRYEFTSTWQPGSVPTVGLQRAAQPPGAPG